MMGRVYHSLIWALLTVLRPAHDAALRDGPVADALPAAVLTPGRLATVIGALAQVSHRRATNDLMVQ
ncbi:MAG: hypothetical protein ABIQ79_08475 [Nitrospiraceae bacterium]